MEYSLEIVLLAFVFGFLLGALFGYGLALISVSNRAQPTIKNHRPNALSPRSKLNIQMSSTDARDLSRSSLAPDRTMKLPIIGKLEPSNEHFVNNEQTTLHVSNSKISEVASRLSGSTELTQERSLTDHPIPAAPSLLERGSENSPDDAEEATRLYEKPFTSNP